MGIVIGVNSDGHGVVVRAREGDEATMNCRISTDLAPVLAMVAAARADPQKATSLMRAAFNIDGVYDWQLHQPMSGAEHAAASDTIDGKHGDGDQQKRAPNRKVGVVPGDGGSRARLEAAGTRAGSRTASRSPRPRNG